MILSKSELFEGIRLARPLLILFICVAHLPGINSYQSGYAQYDQIDTLFSVYVKDFLARGAVPILTVISGYLAFYSFKKRTYVNFLRGKVQRLLLPFILWNLIALCVIYVVYKLYNLNYGDVSSIHSVWDMLKALVGIYRLPINAPTYFLRDLFMIMLILPVIHFICQRYWRFLVAFTAYLLYFWQSPGIVIRLPDLVIPLTFRMDMVLFFAVGYLLAVMKIELPRVSLYSTAVFAILLGSLGLLFSMALSGLSPSSAEFVRWRMLMGGLFVCAAPAILLLLVNIKETLLGRLLDKLSPYSFTIFLSHALSANAYYVFTQRLLGWQVSERSDELMQLLYLSGYLMTVSVAAVVVLSAWRYIRTVFIFEKHAVTV